MSNEKTPAIKSPIWHPFNQHALIGEFPMLHRGEGAYLYTVEGKRLIDAISSWWVVTHGHCNARIQSAITRQASLLDQVIFANYTHQPAEDLAHALVDFTGDGLDYVFYSDSGSTAVEVALKMALGYWANRSDAGSAIPRQRLLVLEHGYHGDTIGTMSVGARGVFNAAYEPLLFDVETIPFPSAGREQVTLDALTAACNPASGLSAQRPAPAAFIVEPLVLGAGGMLMFGADTLREMYKICKRNDVLFIADEIMVGWGRTGARFACDHAGITPDIACYGKGLTGGALPLAVTMCSKPIFDAHYSTDRRKTFFHSSSFTANPIACAAALENLAIWADEPVMERVSAIETMHETRMDKLRALDTVKNLRRSGTIVALEVVSPSAAGDAGYLSQVGPKMLSYFQQRGLLLRPLGNTLYIMPPYCISEADMDEIYNAIVDCLTLVAAGKLV